MILMFQVRVGDTLPVGIGNAFNYNLGCGTFADKLTDGKSNF